MIARALLALAALGAGLAPVRPAAAYEFSPNDRITAAVGDGRFTPRRPAAPSLGASAGKCPVQAPQAAMLDELEILARSSKQPAPLTDVRLCAAAEAFLAWDAKDAPSPALAAFAVQHFGMLANYPRVSVVMVPEEDPKLVAQAVLDVVGNYALNAKRPRYGMMYQRLRKKATRVAIALADEPPVELSAPRSLALGHSGKLTGRLLDDHDRARVLVSDPVGKLATFEGGSAGAFEADLRCGDKPGLIRVEIRGELGGSPVLIARLPVTCGQPLETSAPLAAPEPWAGEPPAQLRKMFDAINAERAAVGVAALAWDEALAGVAASVAESVRQELAKGAFDLPRDLPARLKAVGIASPLVLQNPAQGRSVQEVLLQMQASPGHRASYMDPAVTNAGFGAVTTTGADGRPLVIVDQLFIKELPHLDPVATADKLRAAVVQKRKDGRYPAAAQDAGLDEFAQTFARELAAAAGNLPKARQAELNKTLDKRFKSVAMTFGARQDPLDFAEEAEVTAPGKLFGVGVALGMNEKLGRNAVYAVIVVGQERSGGKEEPAPAPRKGKKK